jgi:hypothetical protein
MVYHINILHKERKRGRLMNTYLRIFAALVLLAGPAVADSLDYNYEVKTVEGCDGVIMLVQFLPNDETTGTSAISLPNTDQILYGTFEHGDVVEFGYMGQPPTYNEDTHFDWGEWVNSQLQKYDLPPLFPENIACYV